MPLFSWTRFFRRRQPSRSDGVSIALLSTGFSIVHYQPADAGDDISLIHAGHQPCGAKERGRLLKELAERMQLGGVHCRLVLSSTDYRMLQTSRPEVPDDELREALRWRIQDMIDFPANEAEIEFYAMPAPRQADTGNSVTVLVCRSDLIRQYTDLCADAGLDLQVIDTPELSLRNLGTRLPESPRGVALLCLQQDRGLVQLQKDDQIYVSRGLSFGSQTFEAAVAGQAQTAAESAVQRLSLEVQRSLDYYESYFGQAPVAGLVVTPIAAGTQQLVDGLNHSLGVIARAMDLGALVTCERMDDALQQACLNAVGGALRHEATA